MSGTVIPPIVGLNWARGREILQEACFPLFVGLFIKYFMPIHEVYWCFHKKLHIWHFWKNMLIFLVFNFFIQDNEILVRGFWLSHSLPHPPGQNIETAFTSNLSKYFILQKCWLCNPTGLLHEFHCAVWVSSYWVVPRYKLSKTLRLLGRSWDIQKLEQHLWHMLMLKTGYTFLMKISN